MYLFVFLGVIIIYISISYLNGLRTKPKQKKGITKSKFYNENLISLIIYIKDLNGH